MRSLEKQVWTVVALAVTTMFSVPAFAEKAAEQTVESTGEAAIVAGNVEAAKQKAKQYALRDAVERVAGTFVTGISESKDWIAVRDEVSAQSGGYVSGWEPVGAPSCDAASCKVTLKVTVSKGKLRDRLDRIGLLIQKQRYPRVLLMVAEQNADSPKPSYWWNAEGGAAGPRPQVFENALMDYLNKTYVGEGKTVKTRKGDEECGSPKATKRKECWEPLPANLQFRFFDYTSLASHPLVAGLKGEKVSDDVLAKIGGLTDAEIIVYGTATAMVPKNNLKQMWNSDSLVASHASGSVRLIDIRTGAVLTTASGDGNGTAVSPDLAGNWSFQSLARSLSVKIKQGLADTWQNQESGSWVKLDVSGVSSYGDLMKFKGLLQDGITGISSVQQREFADGKAKLEVQTTASAEDIAAELSAKKLGPFSVAVMGVKPGALTLKLEK
ncbi:MAG: hypothetical protein P1V51_10705 [Deltaproteobacteria bacterium]|nr:hypothetical protein [Deltaproteobacteria bacterium]